MGLSERLSRYAVRRAHVLVVEAPGAWVVRARLEAAVVQRGWRLALSPADADVLAVCGAPGPELTDVVELLWEQMPGPRVRVEVGEGEQSLVAAALDRASARLADTGQHRRDARSRTAEPDTESDEDMDHGDMDHGDMEMAPGGIPLAGSDDDRDGLEMDVLHLRLGPVLPHWPAGLVLRCTLQGDVITEAEGYLVDHSDAEDHPLAPDPPDDGAPAGATAYRDTEYRDTEYRDTEYRDTEPLEPAWRCDNIARLLALAGWEDAAAQARRTRDAQLSSEAPQDADASLDRLRRQVSRSRLLRWSLRGLRPLARQDLEEHGLPADLAGDTYDRLLAMFDRATKAPAGGHQVSSDAVASAVVGLDLAAARLVVASLDLPPATVRQGVARV